MRRGRPAGQRDWNREPYQPPKPLTPGHRVKLSTTVDLAVHRRLHEAAAAAGLSVAGLIDLVAAHLDVEVRSGAVTMAAFSRSLRSDPSQPTLDGAERDHVDDEGPRLTKAS